MNSNLRFWGFLGVAIVLFVLLTAGGGGSGPPFSPRSVAPTGAKGIVETLEKVGADVRIGQPLPEPNDTAALMLQDRLRPDDRDELRRWVEAGGVLVVADPYSTFLPSRVEPLPDEISKSRCSITALRDVESLQLPPDAWSLTTSYAPACFGSRTDAFVVAAKLGEGSIVSVGSRQLFTNEWLGDADAAALAVSLLAPQPQAASVAFLGPSLVEFGEQETSELLASRVANALYMLGVAFVLYAIHRARRIGGVVPEPLPVQLHGSELVLQAGLLSERSDDPGAAANALRSSFLNRTRSALSLHGDNTPDQVAHALAARLGGEPAVFSQLLYSQVTANDQLVTIAHDLTKAEQALFNPNELVASATGTTEESS